MKQAVGIGLVVLGGVTVIDGPIMAIRADNRSSKAQGEKGILELPEALTTTTRDRWVFMGGDNEN